MREVAIDYKPCAVSRQGQWFRAAKYRLREAIFGQEICISKLFLVAGDPIPMPQKVASQFTYLESVRGIRINNPGGLLDFYYFNTDSSSMSFLSVP